MTLADLKPAEMFSAFASAGSLAITLYFWLVRMKGERPKLKTHLVKLEKVDAARTFDTKWDPVLVLRVAILNLSTRPNVVLGVRAWVRMADGSWGEADAAITDATGAFNTPPQVAEFRELALELPQVPKPNMPEETLSGMSWREVLEPALGGQMTLRVELASLDGKTFTDELTIPRRA